MSQVHKLTILNNQFPGRKRANPSHACNKTESSTSLLIFNLGYGEKKPVIFIYSFLPFLQNSVSVAYKQSSTHIKLAKKSRKNKLQHYMLILI